MANITGTSASETLNGTATSDTISGLGGNDTLNGGDGDDILIGGVGADVLNGGAGTDIASYTTATAGVTINLKTGVHTGDAAGDTFSSIERFRGSLHNDTFVADANATIFDGWGGTINTVDYSTSTAGVQVDLFAGTGTGGDAQGDSYVNINRIVGSSYADTFTSEDLGLQATFVGGSGDDTYIIRPQNTTITELAGGGYDEVLATGNLSIANWANVEQLRYIGTGDWSGTGNSGNNVIIGGAGNDILTGGAGADQLDGGTGGADMASYMTATAGITINLKTGVHTGDATGDTFISVEKFRGTLHNDTFVADSNATSFDGYGGTINTVDYSTSTAGVQVDLITGTGTGGDAQGDSYVGINRIIGSGFSDILTALSGELVGGDGNDIYYISQTATITELAGQGIDEVRTALLTYTLGNNLDNLTYTGASNFIGNGNSLDNVITSGAGDDTLTAGAGNDTIIGNDGADDIDGGDGSDTSVYSGSYEGVSIDLANNTATGGHAIGDVLTSIENLVGSQYADSLLGSASDNVLNGQNGNDTLDGRDGDDILIGGAGADILIGGNGTDVASYVTALAGVTINLETGTHLGEAAGDTFSGIEKFVGSNHADTFVADNGANNFDGGLGTDTVNYSTSTGPVTVNLSTGVNTGGSAAGDILTSIERVIGSAFNDHFTASAGGQTLQGGAGDDIYIVNVASVTVTESASAGNDTVFTSLASYSLSSNVETLTYTGNSNFTGTGNQSNNTISGGNGNDTLRGAGGADLLFGGLGTDTASYSNATAGVTINLGSNIHTGDAAGDVFNSIEVFQGSNHADTFLDGGTAANFRGGSGDDTYVVTSGGTVITELSGGGTDTIQTSLSAYTLGSQLENLTYTGGSSFSGSGNSLNNGLIGNIGNDTLNGQAGADTLFGGGGADTFVFDSAAEATTLGVGDLIQDFSQADGDVIDLSQLGLATFIGTTAFSNTAGELRYEINGALTSVAGDLDGDGTTDFHLDITGSINLTAADFLL